MTVFLLGFAGGMVAPFLEVWNLRKSAPKDLPSHLRQPLFWALTVAMAVVAGVVTVAYHLGYPRAHLVELMYIQIGASTPLILEGFLSKLPSAMDKPDKAGISL